MQHIGDLLKTQEAIYRAIPASPSNNGSSGLPSHAGRHDLWRGFDTHCQALQNAKRRVAEWFGDGMDRGQALVLAGGPGVGKSHLAMVVLGAYNAPHQAFMIGEADLLANIRASYDGDGSERMIMGQYRRAPLLILDDVGVGHVRQESLPWLHDIYWRLFDRRAELRLPALVTTNLSLDELPGRLGQRGFSRLLGMMGGPDNFIDLFSVPDYRARGWK